MARTTIDARLRRAASAAARTVTRRAWGGGLPRGRGTLLAERDRLRAQNEKLRRQAEVLREQRERGRYATFALSAVARRLDEDLDPAGGAAHLLRAIGELKAESLIVEAVLNGDRLDEALVGAVRALLVNPRSVTKARALCTAFGEDGATQDAAAVGLGHYLLVWGSRAHAHEQFSRAPLDLLVRTAAVESVATALHVDRAAGEKLAARMTAHPALSPRDAYGIAGALVGVHLPVPADRALKRAEDANIANPGLAKDIERLRLWLDTHPARLDTLAPPRQRPVLGLLHYDHPHYERASSNLGDYTQTVAMLGHVLRRRGLTLHADDPELETALEKLRDGIAPDLMLDSPPVEVDVVPVSRDASRWEALPEPTWLIAFGWYMHPIFGMRDDLPFHRAVRPVFLSFHVRRPEILTPEAVEYLRRHGPVGCRDWTTVDLLMGHGVDAFFSGCLTTTTHVTAGRRSDAPAGATAVGKIDVLGDRSEDALTQATTDVNDRTLGANLLAAHERHRLLHDTYASVHTSRLHVYLPATSMGIPVTFEPRNAADPRFDGLSDLTPGSAALHEMQERLSTLLDLVLGLVTSGADEAAVYTAWREATAPLVEQARRRREHWRTTHPPVESLAGAAGPVRDGAVHHGEGGDVHVAIALDQNLVDAAPVVLQGIDENTDRDVRVHVLTRGVTPETVESWVEAFPRLRFSHYRFDDVEYGSIARLLAHTTVSTMDRLLLPDVLADLDRVVYVDIDVAVRGDVGELWDLDLKGAPLAARPTASEWAESGLAFIHRAALRLPVDLAREFRAYMHARLSGDFVSFNAGILVLDLARMRSDEFSEHFAGMAGRYGLNDQDVLCCYAGTEAQALDPRWNSFPTREPLPDDARVVHFAGGAKPWGPLPVPAKHHWLAARDRWLRRSRTGPAESPERDTSFTGNYVVDLATADGEAGARGHDVRTGEIVDGAIMSRDAMAGDGQAGPRP